MVSRVISCARSSHRTRHAAKYVLLRCSLLCLLLMVPGAKAQLRSGTITGLVTDQKGSVVSGANIVATDTDTHETFNAKTTDTGLYTIPYLQAGPYTVTITRDGFQVETVNGLEVTPATIIRADATLRVGSTTSVVEVQGNAEQLQTESTSISQAVSQIVVDSIPNVTQNPLYYVTLQNNVQANPALYSSQTIQSVGVGLNGRSEFSNFGVNGGRSWTTEIQLDGLPNTSAAQNEPIIVPNQEGLSEVRIISNNFTADYGRGSGVVEMTTKSGTNRFHGEANFLLRNQVLDANSWGNKIQNISRPHFQRNNAGAAITGPIKKNSLFFSTSFHYQWQTQGATVLATVPTALERVGDFSQTIQQASNGSFVPATLYNPYKATLIAPNLYQRSLVPNSIITAAMLPDPTAFAEAKLIDSFYPLPNSPPQDVFNTNNFRTTVKNTVNATSNNNRVDWKRGRHSVYGSGGLWVANSAAPQYCNVSPCSKTFNNASTLINDRNYYSQIGDTIALNPTLVVDVRYGVMRLNADTLGGVQSGFSVNGQTGASAYGAFGIPAGIQSLMIEPGSNPLVAQAKGGSGGGSNWATVTNPEHQNNHERHMDHAVVGSITKLHGNWTFKEGGEWRIDLADYNDFDEGSVSMNGCCANDPGGNYTFEYVTATGATTSQDNSATVSGIGGAGLLFGAGTWFIRPGANLRPAYASKYFALYSQNDWRMRPNLTLNLGLRWDVQPGPTERYNRMAGYDFTKQSPFTTNSGQPIAGVLSFPGANGNVRNMWETEWHDFQPRIGASWQFKPSWVVRAGYAFTFLPTNTGHFAGPTDYGFASWAAGNQSQPFGPTPSGIPLYEFNNPLGAPIVPAVGSNLAAPQNYGVNEGYFNYHLHNMYSQQANVFVEKSFGKNDSWLLSVGGSDSNSHRLETRNLPFENIQSVNPATLALWRNQWIANNGTSLSESIQVPNPYQPVSGPLLPFQGALANATISQFIPLLPYPLLYGGQLHGDLGFAHYDAFLLSLSHHFSSGLSLNMNYTHSKELEFWVSANAGGIGGSADLFNPRNNKNYSTNDLPDRINVITVYKSQFGSKGIYALDNAVARAIAGGWTLGGVFSMQTGYVSQLSMSGSGAMTSRNFDRNPNFPLILPKSYQHMYDGKTKVTLPCGESVTPPNFAFLKYDLCALQGETLTGANGTSIIPNEYWIGNSMATNGHIRGPGRTNTDVSVRREFPVVPEKVTLELAVNFNNVFNHPEFSGSVVGSAGTMNLVNNPSGGLIPGIGTSGSFGTIPKTTSGGTIGTAASGGTYDPRQITIQAYIKF